MSRFVEAFISGILLMAIAASAKSILDVESLKANNVNNRQLLFELRKDVKDIKNYLLKRD